MPKNLRLRYKGVRHNVASVQIASSHIHGGNAAVAVGRVIINSRIGITAGGIQSVFVFALNLRTAFRLSYRIKNVEELRYALVLKSVVGGVQLCEHSLDESGCG